ncbi:hypothetical protein FJT64_017501 [Amphibalanus amphitrite]|uniref:Uncharacterized protein n=1 Tax=Amphibalanus amphitrite TaxID=1232801 RepID=A0A6A4WW03_AMPAM|nr:hypothetical protein FJT64_017501 [Amphibalanus amphitrite]
MTSNRHAAIRCPPNTPPSPRIYGYRASVEAPVTRLELRTNINQPLKPPVNNRWLSRFNCATLVEEDRTETGLGAPQQAQPEDHSTTTNEDIEINSTAADIGDDYDIDDVIVSDSEGTTVQPPTPVAIVPPFPERTGQ